ncbi:MAG: outer membrane lipoprotein-sorting protein [Bacteroidota bacterium]|nr:outer membrane lipoprotein-sorting protein [Bacteroidota bacterium]
MKRIIIIIIALSAFLFPLHEAWSQEPDAKEIIKKAQDKINGLTSQGTMKMTVERSNWTREVEMKSWSKGDQYYLILITSPPRDKGQVFLKRDLDMWNWMPSISRMIKIPPSMMSQSWMGSDFTNDDLIKMNSYVNDYNHKITGEEDIEGYPCYIIEMIPKPDAAVVWGKLEVWVSKEELYQMKLAFYDEDMILINMQISSEIKQMGDRKLPGRMVMTPVQKPGQKTILELYDMKFNEPIPDDFFSQQNMKKIR